MTSGLVGSRAHVVAATRRLPLGLGAGVVLVALPPLLGRALPGVFSQFHALMLCFGVTYVLAALPLNLLMGYAGQISLGHAAFLGAGAFTTAKVAGEQELPFGVALLVAAGVGSLLALVIGLPALRLRGLYLALVTLGFGLAMSQLVFSNETITRGKAGLSVPRPLAGDFSFDRNMDLLGLIMVVLVAVWFLDRNLVRTKVGRAFQALRQDEDVAASLGVDVARYKTYAFVLYGAFTGVAGAVLGVVMGVAQAEAFTFDFSLFFVTVVVIGGLRSRVGVAAVAFGFAIFPRWFLALEGWDLIIGPALLAVMLVRHPGGFAQLLGQAAQRREAPGHRRAVAPTEVSDAPNIALPLPFRPPAELPSVALETHGVSVHFGGLRAVDDVSIKAEKGRITGVIGPNGAGKTTLFNAISGFVKVTAGQVSVGGHDVTHEPPHRRAALGVGRTFQQGGLIGELSVFENILLAQHQLARYGPARALLYGPRTRFIEQELSARATQTLEVLGFERFSKTPLDQLSHGQQRIVELACVVAMAPAVLLLDEPSAGMSPAATEALAERLFQVRHELGQTIVLIEHHLPLVMATCETVHVLDAGRLLVTGTPDDIRRDERVKAAYLGGQAA